MLKLTHKSLGCIVIDFYLSSFNKKVGSLTPLNVAAFPRMWYAVIIKLQYNR